MSISGPISLFLTCNCKDSILKILKELLKLYIQIGKFSVMFLLPLFAPLRRFAIYKLLCDLQITFLWSLFSYKLNQIFRGKWLRIWTKFSTWSCTNSCEGFSNRPRMCHRPLKCLTRRLPLWHWSRLGCITTYAVRKFYIIPEKSFSNNEACEILGIAEAFSKYAKLIYVYGSNPLL